MQKQFLTANKRARGLGSAHSGSHHWLSQRISAVALVFLSLWFVLSLARTARWEFPDFMVFWGHPFNMILAQLTMLTALYHAVLGLQIVAEDYIHHHGWRFFWLLLIKFIAVLLASLWVYGGIFLTSWMVNGL